MALCFHQFLLIHFVSFLQIQRVDPTLDMEADLGDDYMHRPVNNLSFVLLL